MMDTVLNLGLNDEIVQVRCEYGYIGSSLFASFGDSMEDMDTPYSL